MNIKAVIFDMDGVLLDSETICDKAWEIAEKEMDLPSVEEDVINLCRGTNHNDTIRILENVYGDKINAEDFLNRVCELFREIENTSGIPLMPYAKEILCYLKDKYIISLASSTKGTSVKRQMTNCGLIDYFNTITTGDMVEHSKPDPEIYTLACSSVNAKPEECVAVEDSPNGILSAYKAGMKVIMVPDKIQPDEIIKQYCWKICSSLKDIQDIL